MEREREFNPNSIDSTLARILQRLDEQDRAADRRDQSTSDKLDRIEAQALKTNGRVTASENDIAELKTWQTEVKARVAVYAGLASAVVGIAAFILEHYILA